MSRFLTVLLFMTFLFCACGEPEDALQDAREYRSSVTTEDPPELKTKNSEEIALLSVIHFDIENNYEYLLEQYREIFEIYDELGGLADGYSETWYHTFYDVWDEHRGEIYDDMPNYMGGRCFDMIDGHIKCSENARDYARYLNICFEEIEYADELLSELASFMSEFGGDKRYSGSLSETIIAFKDSLEEIQQRMNKTKDIRDWIYSD